MLFARDLEVADGALQFGFCRLKFPFKLDDSRNVGGRHAAVSADLGFGVLNEAD
jgi:hypothetical protein